MGELWRSELMDLIQIYVQIESARETIDELGKLGSVQFRDVRDPFLSTFFSFSSTIFFVTNLDFHFSSQFTFTGVLLVES
jgi:hypothetical protein